MKAKKCDRCGEYYELENAYMIKLIKLVDDKAGRVLRTMDLCPDCYEELNRYLTDLDTIVCITNGTGGYEK